MKSYRREAFTLVELAIGVLLLLIISGPVVMTLRSGIELYMKTEANAQVTNGVRFTLDSFGRRISPMLNETCEIKILQDPVIPDPVPKYMNYVYLSDGAVVHKDSSGDHVLEGSEHISALNFTVPSSAAESPDNFILDMSINGSYKTAKLDVAAKETLYNTPVKDGNNIISGDYVGNVIVFKTPGVTEMSISFDLYDKGTMIKINNSLMPKGTVILASYDLNITRNGIKIGYTDGSSLDWYISGSTGGQREISIPDVSGYDQNAKQYLLVDNANNAITGDTMLTSGDFYIRTSTGAKVWEGGGYGVIRCRLTPYATTYSGKVLTTETPVWSPYVDINIKTFWEMWLDAINSKIYDDDEFTLTSTYATGHTTLSAKDGKISVVIQSHKDKSEETSISVARLDYKYMDNDRLYSIWQNRTEKDPEDIPTFMTVTNYSVLVDAAIQNIYFYGIILSDTSKTSVYNFNDIGYMAKYQYIAKHNSNELSGVLISKYAGAGDVNGHYGVINETKASGEGNYYDPIQLQNGSPNYRSLFKFDSPADWATRHRILYTVLEYYDGSDGDNGKKFPRFIIRVRFLKLTDEFTSGQLAVIKLRDPWFMGPDFFASEPMWFGEFVGDTLSNVGKTVDIRHYASPSNDTVTAANQITESGSRIFYGLKYGTETDNYRIFKAQRMDIKSDIADTSVKTILSNPARDRYLGLKVYSMPAGGNNFAKAVFNEISLLPGFTADEIRSIMPENGKLYEISETISSDRMPTAVSAWYGATSPARNYNDALFGVGGYSDGSGNNGSRYNSTGAGIIGLQHVPGSCTCPLDNELFKWIK